MIIYTDDSPPGQYGPGFVAYVFFCLFGMCLFVQGLAFFCAGLTSPKASLSQLSYSLVVACTVMIQYYTIGYSLESSDPSCVGDCSNPVSWSRFIGDLQHTFLRNIDLTDPGIIGKLLLRYGFAVVPACLIASAACQRGRFIPLLVFIGVWMTVVYCPVAYWCWHQNGWSYGLGALDYAGGTIIHITSGFGALVYSLVLGPRVTYGLPSREDQPYSLPMVIQGTTMMWLGWIGFTGGSQANDVADALLSILNTMLSAAMGGFSWMILDHIVSQQQHDLDGRADDTNCDDIAQFSLVSFCSGLVSGLVAITPGAGYVPTWAALLFGLCGGLGCNLATKLKFSLGVDDPLDVFAVHGMGGMIGTLLTGVFAVNQYRQPWQPLIQLVSATATAAYTLGCTLVIVVTIDSIPWLSIRITTTQESLGTDLVEHGESAAIGALGMDPNWHLSHNEVTSLDRSRIVQTGMNVPMHPGSFEHPLLQRLPLSYGTYSSRDERDT